MLSNDYHVKVNIAARKFSGLEFRYQTVRELINDYDHATHNIIESSQILFDAAKLLGLVDKKPDKVWRFNDLKTIHLNSGVTEDTESRALVEETQQKIEALSQNLFPNFKIFEAYWSKLTFVSMEEFLQAFYRYIPYAKLGIDDEAPVKNLYTNTDTCVEPLKLGFARQREVLRRVNDVFLKPAPDDLPEFIRESLRGFAVRMEEDAIPLKIVSADPGD